MLNKIKEIRQRLSINSDLLQAETSPISGKQSDGGSPGKEIFAIASSAGGPQALETILNKLPLDFPVPIVIAQDEQSSVIFGMNQEAIERNCIDLILSLQAIPGKMLALSGYKVP